MKFQFNKRYTTIAIYAFLVCVAAILFYGVMNNLVVLGGGVSVVVGLLKPFIYAFAIAYILNPLLKFFERTWVRRVFGERIGDRFKRAVALLLTYIFAAGTIAIFVMIVLPQLAVSVSGLVYKLTNYVNSTEVWLPQLLALLPENMDIDAAIAETLRTYADTIMTTLLNMMKQAVPWMLSFSSRLASGLLAVVVGIIISIYMLMDKEHFFVGMKKIWYAIFTKEKADWLLELSGDANRVFGGFIIGKLLDSLIIGIICFAGMSIFQMPNAILISVIVGVTNVIPYFGPFIGAIPSFFIILIDNPVKALWFLLLILFIQQFDGNILGPKILGESTGLSAFWVIFSIMLAGGLYGFIGMFLGVPIFSVVYMLVRRLINSRLLTKDMPLDDESYCSPEAPLLRPSQRRSEKPKMMFKIEKPVQVVHKVKQLERERDDKDDKKEDSTESEV